MPIINAMECDMTETVPGQGQGQRKVRLNLDITEKLNSELERLAEATGTTKADIMRRGLALAKVAIDEQALGHKLGILDQDRKLIAEIVGV